jgi:iron transport multicopper oxidase
VSYFWYLTCCSPVHRAFGGHSYKTSYGVDSSDTVITLADCYPESSTQILSMQAPYLYPSSTLINGLGRLWQGTINTPLSVTTVASGTRYRLRIISMSCEPAFAFSIDKHSLTMIEVDSTLHQSLSVDSITIYAGQRYSAILTANQAVDNY